MDVMQEYADKKKRRNRLPPVWNRAGPVVLIFQEPSRRSWPMLWENGPLPGIYRM